MRRPPHAPRLDLAKAITGAHRIQQSDAQQIVLEANRHYYHWDEFRRRPLPDGLTPEDAWQAIAWSRQTRVQTPLRDEQGRPFSYWLPDQAQQWIHLIDRRAGIATEGLPPDVEAMRERIIIDSLMEEAIATSQLEGAATTRRVAKDMLRTGRAPRNKGEQMIANGYRTITMLRQRLDEPLSLDLLHDIQEAMTNDTLDDPRDARRLRTPSDNIRVVDVRDNEDVHIPPAAEHLPERLEAMLAYANHDVEKAPFVFPVVRAAILHFWLAYEHPYADGNGRTARALFYWYMLKHRYWMFEFLAISRIIHAAPMKYYRAFLHTETDSNDLTYFIMFQLGVTIRAIDKMRDHVRQEKEAQDQLARLRLAEDLNQRQRALLSHALKHPTQIYSIEGHQRSQGVSYETARSDLLIMKAKGLLREVGRRRPREFMGAPDLAAMLSISNRRSRK